MNGLLCVAAIAASLVATNLAITCKETRCVLNTTATHVICKYPDSNPAPACGNVISVGFTEAEKNEIVIKHNELRAVVAAGQERRGNPGPQPRAARMHVVLWDRELAELAQRWVNQCIINYDDCRDVGRFAVGQNTGMLIIGEVPVTPADVIMKWYNQVEQMNRSIVDNLPFNVKANHYAQLVWWNTHKVGCGNIVYQADGFEKYWMVCNYGPTMWAGHGRPIYRALN